MRSLRAAFDMPLEKVGIKDFYFHDLRHNFATRLVQNGEDLCKVKELLGHKSISVTMRYAHHDPESLRAGVAARIESTTIHYSRGSEQLRVFDPETRNTLKSKPTHRVPVWWNRQTRRTNSGLKAQKNICK